MAVAAPVGEARQLRICANVRLAATAIFTNAVTLAKRNQDAVALLEVVGFLADFFDHTGHIETEHGG